ncbi:MAG: flagellar hook-associated protein FlgK [Melioribacteraceae bacterium]|nr:flagellar hook-associated protein FlgK [Melioribacteraceae bacterium]MCF8355161.1 flagellar hook-associated protein FlgK [Melioribacteraceae bacterium]MCF8392490.1 flagellar hook-associated protein FlgK [Melioribacteraceae bacterium]MCF8418401.1 flagellar hook-associated protein FlgK [Melioribacteraceae bacterium]
MGIGKLFDISRSGLKTYQNALNLTSHNVTNASNPDFSRQRISLGTEIPDYRAKIVFGSGVKISDVSRIQDNITEIQLRKYTQTTSFYEKQSKYLTNIETLLNEPSELGLSNYIGSFFDSWDELAVNPGSNELRTNVIESAKKMTSKLNDVYSGISQVKDNILADAEALVNVLNAKLKELQSVNSQIKETSLIGDSNNDLLDERDKLIKEIAQYGNINVSIDNNNVANVSVGGIFAADDNHYAEFMADVSGDKLSIKTSDGNASIALTGGELYAATRTYSKLIPDYLNSLDQVATSLMSSVNQLHSQGYTIHEPPRQNIDFFTDYGKGFLEINGELLNDNRMIAISSDGNNGDNQIALRIAGLKNEKLIDGKTILEKYIDFTSSLGIEKQISDDNYETHDLVLQKLNEQRASFSGVSVDEEITNILKYQRAYEASARLTQVADELLQTLLNIFN